MHQGRTVFAQLMDNLPRKELARCVKRYNGERYVKSFSCMDQFLCMVFAQLTHRESLRDIEYCLRAQGSKLYHMGICSYTSKSTLADANEKRDYRIWADFAQVLIRHARILYATEPSPLNLDETVYAFDSTIIDLCLSTFPWARYCWYRANVKVHTLLDLQGNIPSFIRITLGKVQDVNILDQLPVEAGAIYVMDRGYLDFARLYALAEQAAYFITRARISTKLQRITSSPVDKCSGLRCDQRVVPCSKTSKKNYPTPLRRVKYVDVETGKRLVLLTNHFLISAKTVADLYRCRWQVELFFRWIKQHLRIRYFYGTSPNAVKTQIYIAIPAYVLVAIVRKKLALEDLTLYKILQILSISLVEKMPILQAFRPVFDPINGVGVGNQLNLFDF